MGGGASSYASIEDINEIISGSMSTIQTSNSVAYQQSSVNIQISVNSKDCNQYINQTSSTVFQSDMNLFSNESVLQAVYADIVNQITAKQETKNSGAASGSAISQLAASITNVLSSQLTSSVIYDFTTTIINTGINIQGCFGSVGSTNVIIGTKDDIYSSYYKIYSQLASSQGISATLANYTDVSQKTTSKGVLSSLLSILIFVAIIIFIIIAVIAAIFLGLTYF